MGSEMCIRDSTYADTMERFNEESLGVSVTIYGTYMRFLAYSDY